MAISWNEIKARALEFSKEWEGESREHAEAKSFWDGFFHVFGISRRRVATYEEPVKKLNEQYGFIDLFWKGTLLVEHKSKGKDLDKAYTQALDYFDGLKEHELPKYVLVSDFNRFRLFDLDENEEHEFYLKDFHKDVRLFGFIAGYQKKTYKAEDPVNIKAAYLMGTLHDQLNDVGYDGHNLEVYLVRLLFCLFADDTGIFEKDHFLEYLDKRTNEDGSDLAMHLAKIFEVLNKPMGKRLTNLDEDLLILPYVNGKLFEEQLPLAGFDSKMRATILECCYLDWGKISPAIFGAMFQSIMDKDERRELGAHYTSEKNILKLIKPLFLDELWSEFEKVKATKKKLQEFHHKLSTLRFFDPACGCGNFLVITYRELRLLELEILRVLYKNQLATSIEDIIWIDVDQFYGIEIDEWPARIAQVALWLMDHQMNMQISEEFGQYFARLPLEKSPTIVQGNALQMNWGEIVEKGELSYILGNPPFVGAKYQSDEQRKDMGVAFDGVQSAGLLDYVCSWYIKAARLIRGTNIKVAFVSTNSISQGEQVSVLWNELTRNYCMRIHFAHRTFQWNSEARGKAAVYCVIIGFAAFDTKNKLLYEYADIKGDAHELRVGNINAYLVDGPDILLANRTKPLCDVPEIGIGNKPVDGGNYLFEEDEMKEFLKVEPTSKKYFRPWMGATEFLYNKKRWVLWVGYVEPMELRKMPKVLERIEAVKQFRMDSISKPTQKIAATPTRFHVENMPSGEFLLIPKVTSERRVYSPIGFMTPDTICSDLVFISAGASMYHFGLLSSIMHLKWFAYTCGRLEGRNRYSSKVVYNNYPWPKEPSTKNKKKVKDCAQKVLDVRKEFSDSSLADLYDPLTMPPKLVKAHQALDKAVDLCYRAQPFVNEMARIEFLFGLYKEYTEPLLVVENNKGR
ncbi:MAG: class I SAM-dependent DNA methyltransferase [Flavobacteriales bacterium]|nr:class I SAM-dependent DNA methyltransferase [Flavobacteriales bacterium]